jgi:glycosyltransferase involved in cell wall biosynthesis
MQLDGIRVALVNWRDPGHSLAGGSERYAWEFARALREAGAVVEFLTAQDTGQSRTEELDGIRVYRRGGQFSFYAWTLLRLLRHRLLRRAPQVVIDAENGIPAFTPVVVGRRTRVVLVVHHVHQEQFRTYFPRPVSDLGRFLEGPAMVRIYRELTTVVVSPSTDAEMRRQLGWQGSTVLVPNGNVAPGLTDQELASAKSVGVRRIVIFGRMAVHKRIDLALEAFARVRSDHDDLRLDLVGSGPIEGELRVRVAELGLDEYVTVHGYLPEEEKNAVLARAWVNICGSDAEGWGQVVVEAAAYAVPTVARDVPGLRDSIRNGETGWLVEDGGAVAADITRNLETGLRHALEVLDDPDQATSIQRACRDWASSFSWEHMRSRALAIVATEVGRDEPGHAPTTQSLPGSTSITR